MLRKGIVALMITVMSVSGLQGADRQKSSGLIGFLKGPTNGRPVQQSGNSTGVKHAVVADAARQVPEIRQTSSQPQQAALQPAYTTPQPMPVQYGPSPYAYGPQMYPVAAGPYGGAVHFVADENQAAAPSPAPESAPAPATPPGAVQGYAAGPGPLYPAPRPGIPHQVGGTAIVHQALHPHEMLYPHRYKAMYGPYYYKVHGGWVVTPFGVWSKENWKLQGTTVDVKYKSHISPFAKFHPPVIR